MAARNYGLFYKVLDGGRSINVRITSMAYPKAVAVRVFQSALLNGLLYHAELKPLNGDGPSPATVLKCDLSIDATFAAWRAGHELCVLFNGTMVEELSLLSVGTVPASVTGPVVACTPYGCVLLRKGQ